MAILKHAPAANTAAIVTLSTTGNAKPEAIHYDYSGTPSGGLLTVTADGVVVFKRTLPAAGGGTVRFYAPHPIRATSSGVVVTLAAAGAGVTGFLAVETGDVV